jgi:DNA repair exonuclease SbcCD ATPase subunit
LKIDFLKINGFGKIKNKEINLEKNINLIYGKNESGKSTVLKFIDGMLYGISKNKNGKDISDYDKYKPWNTEEFSGKINYALDDGNKYEVFREFSKKNPKIYNSNLEEISKQYNIDKNKGNQFFYDQTKIDETLFLSTNIVEQNESVLDSNSQNLLTQKIANILSSGEDNVSYKKVMEKLSKKLIEEVGTERTVGRPINEVTEKIKEIKLKKEELNNCSSINEEIKENKKYILEEIKNIENEINLNKDIKISRENEEKEKEKIKIKEKINLDYEEKINNLKNKLNNKKESKTNNKLNKINLIIILILILLNILINFINISKIIEKIIIYTTVIYLILNLGKYLKNKYNKNKIQRKENIEKIKNEKEIEILEENKKNNIDEINKIEKEIRDENNKQQERIINKYKNQFNKEEIQKLFYLNLNNMENQIELLNREYNNKKIELNTINIKESENNIKIQNKLECEEQLEYYQEQKNEIEKLEKSIKLAKDALEQAYSEMKNEVTPKFTKDLSNLIEKISNNKYKNAKFDSEYGLRVEMENGEYMDCNRLSIGTIDQLYLSLRLSAMNEITEETMPIILDEAFAYYDSERLENILKYIYDNYKNNQVIIFTCTNREKQILDKLNMEYNLINL